MKPKDADEPVIQEFNLDDLKAPELLGHQWMQRGNQLQCSSCPFHHGAYIDPDYQLYGIDEEGRPMLRKIVVRQ